MRVTCDTAPAAQICSWSASPVTAGWLALASLLGGCGGSAHFIVRDDEGGLVSLEGDEAPARADAIRLIEAHCGASGYRVMYDGTASVSVGGERVPTADESASRMALPSDLPGALELSGTSPPGGAGVTTGGAVFAHDPARADRVETPRVDRRRRIEYECLEADEASEVDPSVASARVAVPAQSFEMGSPDSEPARDDDEGPRLRVEIGAFAIDRTPVTVRAFASLLAEVRAAAPGALIITDAETPAGWTGRCNLGSSRDDHPMNCVSFEAARAYCHLVSADLPTEAERELVARAASESASYFWGDTFEADHAVSSVGCGMRGCRGGTAPIVVEGPRCNALGVCDVAGNVWEWTLTEYAPALGEYVTVVPEGAAAPSAPVHRGGSWLDEDSRRFRSAFRGLAYPENGLTGVGFRCVVRD